MNIHLRESQASDLPFLRKILYEAVFWRASPNKPSFEEGLAFPEVHKCLADWGARDGDTAVVATINSTPVGAAWYRYWTEANPIRGYLEEAAPVLVIGVLKDYRHQGIGKKMIAWLVETASQQAIPKISLMVAKDNYALNLYQQQGFQVYSETEDSFLMVRTI
jgi:ribosomal protein S18 acetylase RimI-like enzyme